MVLVLSIPAIQTTLGKYATKQLNATFKTKINIARVSLQFNGDVALKKIYIEDYKKDTLISIENLNTSILGIKNLFNNKLVFGDVDIEYLFFNIKTYKGETNTNLDFFIERFETDNPSKSKTPFLLSSSDISVYHSVFKLSNENFTNTKLLHLENLNLNTTNFLVHGPNVSSRLNTLSFKDSRGVVVKNIMADFDYSLNKMRFLNLHLKTPNSILNGNLEFFYERQNLRYFFDKVNLKANFNNSHVLLDELNIFYNEFGKKQQVNFTANISGTLNHLKIQDLKLLTNTHSEIYGGLILKNVFTKDKDDFFMDGDFKELSSTYQDLKELMPRVIGNSIPTSLKKLGYFTITGKSQITSSNIKANFEMDTELGFVKSNLQIDKLHDIDNSLYEGKINFDAFDFGTFFNDPNIGEASLDFNIRGQGFTKKNLNARVKGEIVGLEFNKYNYKNLKVAGKVQDKIFDGNLIVNDKNLQLNFSGLVDFSETINKYDFEAEVLQANLKALNFIKKDSISVFKCKVKMNVNSSNLDDAYGDLLFTDIGYTNQNNTHNFKKLHIESKFINDVRYVHFNSPDIIQGELKGRFLLKDLGRLFENSIGYNYTNYKPHEVEINQNADFNFEVNNKILEAIYPVVELGENTFVRGTVESNQRKFKLTLKSPKIRYLENTINHIELQVDNNNPMFNTYIKADSLNTKYYNVSAFNLINVTINDTLFMRSEFNGGKTQKDHYNLSFYHTINKDNESVVGFKKSDFTVKDVNWVINSGHDNFHKITFDKKMTNFEIEKFKITHDNDEIKLSGFIRDSTEKDLQLDFKNVDLSKVTPEIKNVSLAGNINGTLDLVQKNGSYLPNSTISVDDFKVNNYLLGSFDAKIKGNQSLTNYEVDVSLKNDISKTLNAKGNVFVSKRKSNVDVDLNFKNFNVDLLNPFLEGVLSDIRGDISGKINVVGNLKAPKFTGDLILKKAGLSIPYLNVDYNFQENITVKLENQSFNFKDVKLLDSKFASKGLLNGSISHTNFSKWRLDLDLETPRLLVLDTKEEEESLYYGTGFMGGTANIFGPADQLKISVVGETKKGTVFKIPFSDSASYGDNSYMHFISKEEKVARKMGEQVVFNDLKGLELDFDLDVNQEARVELIIDKRTGHALKGRGVGGLLIEINTNGKFDMWGDFSVFEGVYNFAYGGLIQKEFIVQPGGTIAWDGEPLKPKIDMLATYKTQTNPSPLLDNPINRAIPVELNISLNGDLEQLDPNFTFEFPNVNSAIKSELNYRLESEENKQDQALYLISTGSFSTGVNDVNFSGTIAERLNGIINGIFASGDSKLNVGLNYQAGQNRPDYQTDDRVGMTLQTQISDRVLINGKVGVPVGGATETVVAGNVEIDFLLNEKGTLTAKVFSRENSIRNFGDPIGYTQGLGISYNVDFNTFRELIRKILKKPENSN